MRLPIGCAAAENVESEFDGDVSVSVWRPSVASSVAATIVNDVPSATVTIAPGAPVAFGSRGRTSALSEDQSMVTRDGSTPAGIVSDTAVVHIPSAVSRQGDAENGERTVGFATAGLAVVEAGDAGAGDAGSAEATVRAVDAILRACADRIR